MQGERVLRTKSLRGEEDFCCKFPETLPIGSKANVVSVPLLGTRDSPEMRF